MEIALVLVLILIVVVIIAIRKRSEKDWEEMPPSKLVLGEEYISGGVPVTGKIPQSIQNHVVSVIYKYPDLSGLWICPNCECENAMHTTTCSVCNKAR